MKDKDKAIVKETNQEYDVKDHYGVYHITCSFTFPLEDQCFSADEDIKTEETMTFTKEVEDPKREGWHYVLSDGKDYHESEVIVGAEEIRNYKINQIDGIQ